MEMSWSWQNLFASHKSAIKEVKKLGSAKVCHIGEHKIMKGKSESESISREKWKQHEPKETKKSKDLLS